MEDILTLSQPTPKDALRLILAFTIYNTKPPNLTLTDYLVELRVQAYTRRLARSRSRSTRGRTDEAALGVYGQLNPFLDMMGTVTRLFQERETERARARARAREEDREKGRIRIDYEYTYMYPSEVIVQGPDLVYQEAEEDDYEDDGL